MSGLMTILAIHLPIPAPILSGVVGGMLIAGVLFWFVENVLHDDHHGIAALVCLGLGLIGGILIFRYVVG